VGRRIIVLFVIGVAVPSGLLGYLALRGVRNDQALFELEQRESLEDAGQVVLDTFESRMAQVERRALTSETITSDDSPVDAVFTISPDGRFSRLLAWQGHYSSATPDLWADDARTSHTDEVELSRARKTELRHGDLPAATKQYTRLVDRAQTQRGRAKALVGLARVARRQHDWEAAADTYRRLASDYGDLRSAVAIPFALVGRLELLSMLEEIEDNEKAVVEARGLLEELVEANHGLSAAQYAFVSDRVRSSASRVLETLDDSLLFEDQVHSLRALLAREEMERRRSDRIEGFVTTAIGDPTLLKGLFDRSRALGPQGATIQGAVGPHSIYLPSTSSSGESEEEFLGLLIDPARLERMVEEVVRSIAGARDFRWVLRTESSNVRASSGPEADSEEPIVTAAFPGRFPTLTLELLPPSSDTLRSFFASPRSVYLYAFLLVVGLLAGGLALTVRTLSQQLQLARMQSDFVSTVSHELKSPVTAIRQLSEMLQAERVPSETRRRRYFDALVELSERLTTLIDHVLDFARMDAGHTELDLVEVDLRDLLAKVVAEVQERVHHRGFSIGQEIHTVMPRVTLDSELIALAITNMIDNSIKFSGDSRQVIVKATVEADQAIIGIEDYGIGMDPDELDRVFERFYRGGEALTRSVKGTGLGLTLVKQIVEAHGGSIEVKSERGRGSVFAIRLPVSGP